MLRLFYLLHYILRKSFKKTINRSSSQLRYSQRKLGEHLKTRVETTNGNSRLEGIFFTIVALQKEKKKLAREKATTYATVWRPLITSVNHELRMLRCVWHLPLSPFRCKDNRSTWLRVDDRVCTRAERRQARVAFSVCPVLFTFYRHASGRLKNSQPPVCARAHLCVVIHAST